MGGSAGRSSPTAETVLAGGERSAAAVARAVRDALKSAPADSPELAAAYDAWFVRRLAKSGTMAGAAPRPARRPRRPW